MAVEHILILLALGIAVLLAVAILWRGERVWQRISQQIRADRVSQERHMREARSENLQWHLKSDQWRREFSLLVSRIAEVVDTPPEEGKG